MEPAGIDTLARWRESGEWWKGEPGREIHRYIDKSGIRREVVTPLAASQPGHVSEIRIRRTRDEKVRLASGTVIPPQYGKTRNPPRNALLLHALSGYAFGRGAMVAAEIPAFAAENGYAGALLADPLSLTGAVEFCKTADEVGVFPLVGTTIELEDGSELVLVAKTKQGYRSLSRLITDCHLQEPRMFPICNWDRLERHCHDLICLTGGSNGLIDRHLIRQDHAGAYKSLATLIQIYGRENVFIEIERSCLPWGISAEKQLLALSEEMKVRAVAGGPILHERKEHFPAQDVLVCIDSLCLIDEVEGRKPRRDPLQPQVSLPPRRGLNAERYLRPIADHSEWFSDRPDLISNGWQLIEACERNVLPSRAMLPQFSANDDEVLYQVVRSGAIERYPRIPRRTQRRIDLELERIVRLGFQRHFLIAWDMCNWARGQGILLSGRGSVVDCVIAYCLGISRIDAQKYDLHFDRFMPADGSKRPDIDIDFEAAKREDVRQYLVGKYGKDHVATIAAIGTFGSRGIIREVGKVMGIPDDLIGYLAKRLHGGVTPERLESALQDRPELRDSNIPRAHFKWVFTLSERLMDLPRNLRSHSSGVIIGSEPIADSVPVVQSGVDCVRIIQWDKRSAKRCFDKFDVLCLRGNDVLGGTARRMGSRFDVSNLPLDDPEVFRTMRSGNMIGIPQSASPAMRQAHIRIGTENLKDAGIVQAGIRPGVGGAVKLNEFVARRKGKPYRLIHVDMEAILGPTLGIVVFQEQIDRLLQTFGGYSGDEAEEIRENIHKNKRDYVEKVRAEVVQRFLSKGYSRPVAEEVYELVSAFKGYGFAEGHALAFAEISIRSIWCQQNYPSPYFAALLDAQPAGYYGPVTIANEARIRGVKVLPPDFNLSRETFKVEDVRSEDDPKFLFLEGGMRVALKQMSGVSQATRNRLLEGQPFTSFFDFVAKVNPPRDELEQMILCGLFDSSHPNRRALMWAIPSAMDYGISQRKLKGALDLLLEEPSVSQEIDDFSDAEKAVYERRILGLDINQHLMGFERKRISAKGGLSSAEASTLRPGKHVFVVGNPIRLRFPPTQSGRRVMFFDLEDETGLLNVTCFDDVYQRDGHKVICHPYITLWGETEDRDGHLSFQAHRIFAYEPFLSTTTKDPLPLPIVTSDFLMT